MRCLLKLDAGRNVARDRLVDQVAHLRRRVGDLDTGVLERLDLGIGAARLARDDGARVAHASARRRRHARYERDDRLGLGALVVLLQVLGRLLLSRAADLSNQHNTF